MRRRNLMSSPEIFYGRLSLIPALLPLLRDAPHLMKIEVIGERQFYDRVYRIWLRLDGKLIVEEVVRDADDNFLCLVNQLGGVRTRYELLALDKRDKINYD